MGFGVGGDVAVGVEAADRAVAFAEDLGAVFDQRLDLVDEGFFVELVFGRAFGFLDGLEMVSFGRKTILGKWDIPL